MTPRDRDVLDVLAASGTARVETLARKLGVTEETIRRAAKRLEAQGLVTKTHGALHLREAGAEPNFAQRMQLNAAAKRRIGRSVAALIPDGASLFLDVGSTTAYVAQALQIRRDLMVVTNSLPVASALTGRNGNRVFWRGANCAPMMAALSGPKPWAFWASFAAPMPSCLPPRSTPPDFICKTCAKPNFPAC